MYGVGVTNEGMVVLTLNGMNYVLNPQAADDFCGLIAHAVEIAQDLTEMPDEEPTKH